MKTLFKSSGDICWIPLRFHMVRPAWPWLCRFFFIQLCPNFHMLYYYSYNIMVLRKRDIDNARICGRAQCPTSYHVLWEWLLYIWTHHPRRVLSALEIYNFPRHEFSQNTVVARLFFFQTSWFNNLKWKCFCGLYEQMIHLHTCAIGYILTGILWLYVLLKNCFLRPWFWLLA